MLSDLYGCPVKTIASEQGPALGVAILAGVGAGVYDTVAQGCATAVRTGEESAPDSGRSAAYEPYDNLYRSLYPALREQFRTLASLG